MMMRVPPPPEAGLDGDLRAVGGDGQHRHDLSQAPELTSGGRRAVKAGSTRMFLPNTSEEDALRHQAIARILNLIADEDQQILNLPVDDARALLLSEDPRDVLEIQGSFALVARDGQRVCLARSLDRPLRYFLAKEKDGPMLVVADRIDSIRDALEAEGHGDQFHLPTPV
jgi:hypothetical protein